MSVASTSAKNVMKSVLFYIISHRCSSLKQFPLISSNQRICRRAINMLSPIVCWCCHCCCWNSHGWMPARSILILPVEIMRRIVSVVCEKLYHVRVRLVAVFLQHYVSYPVKWWCAVIVNKFYPNVEKQCFLFVC